MARNIRIGLIGCGLHGLGNLSAALKTVEGVELTACADVDEAATGRAMQEFGYSRAYLDYRQMLSKEDRHPTTLQPRRSLVAEMYQDEMRAWTASLAEKCAPPITVDDGVRVLEIIDAIFESGKTGSPVELKR
jgi:predicted dehydrogenase